MPRRGPTSIKTIEHLCENGTSKELSDFMARVCHVALKSGFRCEFPPDKTIPDQEKEMGWSWGLRVSEEGGGTRERRGSWRHTFYVFQLIYIFFI